MNLSYIIYHLVKITPFIELLGPLLLSNLYLPTNICVIGIELLILALPFLN